MDKNSFSISFSNFPRSFFLSFFLSLFRSLFLSLSLSFSLFPLQSSHLERKIISISVYFKPSQAFQGFVFVGQRNKFYVRPSTTAAAAAVRRAIREIGRNKQQLYFSSSFLPPKLVQLKIVERVSRPGKCIHRRRRRRTLACGRWSASQFCCLDNSSFIFFAAENRFVLCNGIFTFDSSTPFNSFLGSEMFLKNMR